MEVCKIVEGQKYSKKLNDRQVTNILRATCKRPQEREQSIRDMVLHNNYADDKFAQEFGIKVCSDLVSVPARVLPPPLLKYNDSGREKTCAPSVQWNMINKKMMNDGTIDNWTCMNFSCMRPEENVNPRPFVEVKSAAPNHIENALRDVHRRATQMAAQQGTGSQLQLLIVILPDVSGSYGKIKRVCETDIGIVSKCCLPKHASRPNKQYLDNVALKVNVKVGGRNTVLERAFVCNDIPFVSEVPTIIFGADVTHPPPGEDSASSIAPTSLKRKRIARMEYANLFQDNAKEIEEDIEISVGKKPKQTSEHLGKVRLLDNMNVDGNLSNETHDNVDLSSIQDNTDMIKDNGMESPEDIPEQKDRLVNVFIKGIFEKSLSVQLNLLETSSCLAEKVYERTKMKIADQYFSFSGRKLMDDETLKSQGVRKDCHIYLCPRVRGGRIILGDFLQNRALLVSLTALYDGSMYPDLTDRGCLSLSSLMHQFTYCLATGYCWPEELPLEECFEVDFDRVYIRQWPTIPLNNDRLRRIMRRFATMIGQAVEVNHEDMPPYFSHLIHLLNYEVPNFNYLEARFRFVLDTHISMAPSKSRESIMVVLRLYYESLSAPDQLAFNQVLKISMIDSGWLAKSETDLIMNEIHLFYQRKNLRGYLNTKPSAFHLLRNYTMHAPGNSQDRGTGIRRYGYDSGLEILVYLVFGDFLASILHKLHCFSRFDVRNLLICAILARYP